MHALHAWMADELHRHGAHIDAFYFCPHHPEGVVAALARTCSCRKPAPGMIEKAMRDWPVDARSSFLVGDKPHDIAAAEAAGIRGVLYERGNLRDFVRANFNKAPNPKYGT
jgi:D-glycero-D-manno-heptose 1,7-bisphosphate phosphatase